MVYDIGGELFTLARACSNFGMVEMGEALERLDHGWCPEETFLRLSKSTQERIDDSFGLHFVLDGYDSPADTLLDLNAIFRLLNEFPESVGMTKISQPYVFNYSGKVPEDHGVTGSVILAESHAAIHTFPSRKGFFSFDLYSCKAFDPYDVLVSLRAALAFQKFELRLLVRGREFKR